MTEVIRRVTHSWSRPLLSKNRLTPTKISRAISLMKIISHMWIVSIPYVKWKSLMSDKFSYVNVLFHMWNTCFIHQDFTCKVLNQVVSHYELNILYIKRFAFHMWNENFIRENFPISHVFHMLNNMWNFRGANAERKFSWHEWAWLNRMSGMNIQTQHYIAVFNKISQTQVLHERVIVYLQ